MEKLQPKLRFPEFSLEWEKKKLGELLEFKNGINATKEQYGRGIKFINVLDILNNDFITHDKIIGSVDVEQDIANKFSVNYGDILFQRSSETREEVGTACVYLDKEVSATFGGFVIRGKKIGEYDPIFLNKLLKTDLSRDAITSKSGGSTRYNIGQEILNSIDLPFPPLLEQKKISNFLTAVDAKLSALKRQKNLLEQYKKGIMQKIFSQELRFKDDNGDDFPDWKQKNLGEVVEMKNGYAFKSSSYSANGKYNITTISNVQNGYLDIKSVNKVDKIPNDAQNHQILEIGDLLISLTGNVGRVCIVSESNCLLNQRVGKLIPINISIEFLFQLLRLESFLSQMIADSQGGAQLNLSKSDIERYKIYLPSPIEQTKIANFLSAIDDKINHCQIQIKKTEIWKKGLLQQMFV